MPGVKTSRFQRLERKYKDNRDLRYLCNRIDAISEWAWRKVEVPAARKFVQHPANGILIRAAHAAAAAAAAASDSDLKFF